MSKAPWPEVCAVAAVSVSTAVAIRGWPFVAESGEALAAWVGSVATSFAAVVALYFGLAEARKRQDERRRSHKVYRWLYQRDVGAMLPALEELADVLSAIRTASAGATVTAEAQTYLLDLGEQIRAPALNAHVEQLKYLALETGEKLARLAADGPRMAHFLERVVKGLESDPVVTDKLRRFCGALENRVEIMAGVARAVIIEDFGDPDRERGHVTVRILT